ncbi:MAG TPA: carbohydrate-binding protein [Polyangiaceae bacterium]|nr:carbohydrate-binding protein [Polyangiaceae bacterium]
MQSKWCVGLGAWFLSIGIAAGCGQQRETTSTERQPSGPPSTSQVPLSPTSIPKFAHELPIPRVFAPSVVGMGPMLHHEYTVSVQKTTVQMLPPGFPDSTVLAYGGEVKIPNSSGTELVRSVPGPVFETIRGIHATLHWRNEVTTPHFMPVDPTLHWANPNAMEPPAAPFTPFPPGYAAALFPVAHVTHMHGLVVGSDFDGVAEQWFTAGPNPIVGPTFVSRDYDEPNEQPPTQLFYHDHTMGQTRLDVYSGLVGAGYFIRDPNNPLDQPSSPLPSGAYEIPLIIFDRSFFTDGELNFPRVSTNPANAYWQAGDGANVVLVNGKVWPNLNVERRQYRFRTLAMGNGRTFDVKLDNAGVTVPFTLIGSDGGYLPAPQVVNDVMIATTERADMLVDFSGFSAGTQLTMLNAGADPNTVGTIMRFTVVASTAVPPPALPAFPPRPALPTNAPKRIKTLHNITDAAGNAQRATDGIDFTAPPSEYPLVGSTEAWDLVNIGGGSHQIHLHLIEFQVVERQSIDTAAYLRKWQLLNGQRPVSRPITLDPTPFLIGAPIPALPYESGWKDTVRAPGNQVTRIVARWAPQEAASGSVTPGQNLFPIDPTIGPGYVWHCHVLGHEDNDMMRPLKLVSSWTVPKLYAVGDVFEYQGVDYRARVQHNSIAMRTPPTRFDLYERVNNNDGTWQPQIIYAVGDRVLYMGQLYMADAVHQSQTGAPPPSAPTLWHAFPMTACGQLAELCHDGATPGAVACHATGHAGDEPTCLAQLSTCLAACDGGMHGHAGSPCSGLCSNPVSFTVPDGTTFDSGALGTGEVCYETTSELVTGDCLPGSRPLSVNGHAMVCNGLAWTVALPTQRHHGYCIQVPPGSPSVSFHMH